MRILFFIIFISMSGCTTIEVAKEVSKATRSIKNSVDNMINPIDIDKENEILEAEKEKEVKIIIEQKKFIDINFLEKTIKDIELQLGKANLIRVDDNIQITRFDSKDCRLFLFSNPKGNVTLIKYFEIRNNKGLLILNKKKIESCYKDFNLI